MWRRDINPRRYALITRISHVPVTIVGRGWDWVCIDGRLGGKWGSMCMEVSERLWWPVNRWLWLSCHCKIGILGRLPVVWGQCWVGRRVHLKDIQSVSNICRISGTY